MNKICLTVEGKGYPIPLVLYEPEAGSVKNIIIALHGFGGDKESSAVFRLAETATERKTAVACFDFPAHGESPACERELTVENCINDGCSIYAFVKNRYFSESESNGNIHFFATSFGAFVLTHILKKPEFAGCKGVFRAPAVMMHETFERVIANSAAAELAKGKTVECGFERKLWLGYSFYCDLVEHRLGDAFFENEVLMIYGDRDDVVSPEHMRAFGAARESVRELVISGADHRFKNAGETEQVIEAAISFYGI